jgi:hypothetical protein
MYDELTAVMRSSLGAGRDIKDGELKIASQDTFVDGVYRFWHLFSKAV